MESGIWIEESGEGRGMTQITISATLPCMLKDKSSCLKRVLVAKEQSPSCQGSYTSDLVLSFGGCMYVQHRGPRLCVYKTLGTTPCLAL